MRKIFTGFLFVIRASISDAQHFGFSQEISSYAPPGANEVQLTTGSILGIDKMNGHLLVLDNTGFIAVVDQTNGKTITRFGDSNITYPSAATTDSQGNYYIINGTQIFKYDPNGNILLFWGGAGTGNGQFNAPYAICTDDADNVYIADTSNNNIQKFDTQGSFITKWGSFGAINGSFDQPQSIVYWPSLGLVIADHNNNRLQVFDKNGTYLSGIANTSGSLGVDLVNDKLLVQSAQILQYSHAGLTLNLVAKWGPDGTPNTHFSNALSIAVSSYSFPSAFSRAFAVENNRLLSFYLGGATNGTLVGSYGTDGSILGEFNAPVSADYANSTLYVLDREKYDAVTKKFQAAITKVPTQKTSYPTPFPTDLVISGGFIYMLDRTLVTTPSNHLEIYKFDLNNNYLATISIPAFNIRAWTMDTSGNFYCMIANLFNPIYDIYKLDNTGAQLINWSTSSSTNYVPPIVTDVANNLYVIDQQTDHILKYNTATSTLTSTFGIHGSATGQLNGISSVDVDAAGNLYVLQNDRFQIFDNSFNFLQRVDLPYGMKSGSMIKPFIIRVDDAGSNLAILDHLYYSDRVQLFTVKTDQAINFSALPAKIFGSAPFQVSATGGASGNPITYNSSNLSVATVSGNTITIVGTGQSTITTNQAGNVNYNSAPSVQQTFTVTKANQAITFSPLASVAFGVAPYILSATGGTSGNAVTFSSSNLAVATISANTITIVGVGQTTITASQTGNANYNSASDVSQTLIVTAQVKTNQIINFPGLQNFAFGTAPFILSATGGASSNPVIFTSSNLAVATISGNTVTIVGAGQTVITASQGGDATYNPANDVQQMLTVNKADQSIIFSMLPDVQLGVSSFTLSATGGASGNPITFTSSDPTIATISGNTVAIAGIGQTTITASQAGNTNYNAAADVTQTLTVVARANQTINFTALPNITFGASTFVLSATSTSGLSITFSTLDDEVTISGTQVTIIKPGYVTINADQSGSSIYNAATQVQQGFCVYPVKPTIQESLDNSTSPVLASSNTTGNQWYLNGVAISGATNATYNATFAGQYTVNTSAEACVSAISDAYELIVTAIEKENAAISISPNPADNFITINAPADIEISTRVAIYNMTGQTILTGGTEYLNQPINVSQYAKGIYITSVIMNGKNTELKFMKK